MKETTPMYARSSLFALLFFGFMLFIVLPQAGHSQTATYYVATNGDDATGDGSRTNPWATITHALDNAADGSLILVRPGTYNGRVRIRGTFEQGVTVRSEVPYMARLRHNSRVITAYQHPDGVSGITIEGFDIAHSGAGAGALVIHFDGNGDGSVSRITLRNNILHDSFNNDILKINNASHTITVTGNMFYNQTGSDEHIDINGVADVIVQDNIFFNNFAASGRTNPNNTSSYIVIKDSNGPDDAYTGSRNITVRRNIFLNWQGSTGHNFVLIGEDGKPYFEAENVLVENNLMLGNSPVLMRSPFSVKGGRAVTFRNNTVVGDMPSRAFAMRLISEGSNPPNENIEFYNNIWSDPTGTMGARTPSDANDFSDAAPEHTASFVLHNNLYWNGGSPIPQESSELINYTDDSKAIIADPLLAGQDDLIVPHWDPAAEQFLDGSTTIRQAFERLVRLYGTPAPNSAVVDAAAADKSSGEDILGRARSEGSGPDVGAVEVYPTTSVSEAPAAPGSFYLLPNYPNPFNPETIIRYELGRKSHVELAVFSVTGRKVATLFSGTREAGSYQARWNGTNALGKQAPSGLYFYQLRANGVVQSRKMLLLR